MSGWIKMGVGLRRHPKVVRMASALKADKLRVVGALHAVWCVFDEHSDDGHLQCYTLEAMDSEIGWKGFSAAMQSVGWLIETPDGVDAPDYEEHNGASAKRRVMEASRKGKARKASASNAPTSPPPDGTDGGTGSGQTSASHADKVRNREEKRREEKIKTPPLPSVVAPLAPRAARKCPADFVVSQTMTEWAIREVPGIALQAEHDKFRDHTFRTAMTDWPGAWRNWMRKAAEFAAQKPPQRANGSHSGETAYARSMREKYEQIAPAIAARRPGETKPLEIVQNAPASLG